MLLLTFSRRAHAVSLLVACLFATIALSSAQWVNPCTNPLRRYYTNIRETMYLHV